MFNNYKALCVDKSEQGCHHPTLVSCLKGTEVNYGSPSINGRSLEISWKFQGSDFFL